MNKNVCPHCGEPFSLDSKLNRYHCRYCGYVKPMEATEEEQSLLYAAAQKLRMADFDDARDLYEDIASKFPSSAEARWGIVLCEYGIKYEDDYDGKKIPSCYAARYESFLDDPNYKKALQLADENLRNYYESQAKRIEATRKEWVEKAEKEPPYDIFLSFKDTEDGQRTADSYDAHELYNILTGLGYHVFFSRVTLQGKTGENYEPYIFAALNSAPVMLVFGSKPEYITSTWIKNEWARFLSRIRNKQKREDALCVIVKGFSPSLLPKALRNRQCLKYDEVMFIKNLESYCEKVVNESKVKTLKIERKEIALAKKQGQKSIEAVKAVEASSVSKRTANIKLEQVSRTKIGTYEVPVLTANEESKLAQADIYRERGDFDRALGYYEDVLSSNPKSGDALLGKMLCLGKSANLNAFLNKNLENVDILSDVLKCVDYSNKETANAILDAYAKSCVSLIKKREYERSLQIYKEICNYDVPSINNLHKTMIDASIGQMDDEDAVKIGKVALPYLASDPKRYKESLLSLIEGCVMHDWYEQANEFCVEFEKYFDFDANSYLLSLRAKQKKKTNDELLIALAKSEDFSCLSEQLPLPKEEVGKLFDLVSISARSLIQNNPEAANLCVRFLISYEFPLRDQFIEKGIDACCSSPSEKTSKVLDGFLRSFGDESFGRFLDAQKRFSDACLAKGEKELAIRYIDRLIEYDPGNPDHHKERIAASLSDGEGSWEDNFGSLKDFSDIEAIVSLRGDKKVMDVLKPYFDICVDKKRISKDICKVFDTLSTYVPKGENAELQGYLRKIAPICKEKKMFEESERYYALLVTFDAMDHESYWGLLQSKMRCSSDEEMILSDAPLADFVEFENAKLATGKDRGALSRYIDVEDKQRKYKEDRIASEKQKALLEAERNRNDKRLLIARKRRKKIALISSFSFLGIIAVVFGVIGIGNIVSNSRKTPEESISYPLTPTVVGDSVYYGLYPQTHVSDSKTISSLNAIHAPESNGWYLLNGEYYAKRSANPVESSYKYSDGSSVARGSSDWFLCEPIEWKILSQSDGEALVVSSVLLDAHRYDDNSNNYFGSEIRQWLNDDFYGSAFPLDSSAVLKTEVDNSAPTTDSDTNPFACENTQDKVFLLSYQDYLNEAYGFSNSMDGSETRKCFLTDWALAGGAYQYEGYGVYYTRSPYSGGFGYARFVVFGGTFGESSVNFDGCGVRPGLRLKIGEESTSEQSAPPTSESKTSTPVLENYISYGLYPQTHVNDAKIIKSLNAIPTPESNGWYRLNGEYYAKKSANPYKSGYKYSDGSWINKGFFDWFRCEPIEWKVLSQSDGEAFVVSSVLLDAHRYNESYSGLEDGHYANNYKYSEIRQWLNDDFYGSAFSLDPSSVLTTDVDNSAPTTDSNSNSYACENTQDKVFLLSYKDYLNKSYGFSGSVGNSDARKCGVTDWALASGACQDNGYGRYYTRSPYSGSPYYAWSVGSSGGVGGGVVGGGYVSDDDYGVRPGLRLKIASGA